MGAGISAVQVISLIQSITKTIEVVAKHGPQWIETLRGSRQPIEDGCSGRQQQDQQQIQRLVQQLQQYEKKVDDLMMNEAELRKTIEAMMCLKNQIINSVASKEGDVTTNRIRADIDVPQNLEDSDEVLRHFWKSLSEIEDKSTSSNSSYCSEEKSTIESEFQMGEPSLSGGRLSMENKLSEALTGIQECYICREHYDNNDRLPCVLSCGHTYCKQCIVRMSCRVREHKGTEFEWYYDSLRCPECRIESELDVDNLIPNDWLVQLLENKSPDRYSKTGEESCGHESSLSLSGATASYTTLKTNEDSPEDDDDDDIKSMKLIQRLEEEEKSWDYALQLDKEEKKKHREIREKEEIELALAISLSETDSLT